MKIVWETKPSPLGLSVMFTFDPFDETSVERFRDRGFALDRPIFTNHGEPVIVLSTNGPGSTPIIGLIVTNREDGNLHRWAMDGKSYTTRSPDSIKHLVPNLVVQFSFDARVKMRGGQAFRIIGHDRAGSRKHYGFANQNGHERAIFWYDNGRCNQIKETPYDLINI